MIKKIIQTMLFMSVMFCTALQAKEKPVTLKSATDTLYFASGAKMYEEDLRPSLIKFRAYKNPSLFAGQDREDILSWNKKYLNFFMYGAKKEEIPLAEAKAITYVEQSAYDLGEMYRKNGIPALITSVKKDFKKHIEQKIDDKKATKLIIAGIYAASEDKDLKVKCKTFLDDILFVDKYGSDVETLKKRGKDYLEENKQRAGVKTLKSGVQYEIIEKGHGKKATWIDSVVVDYKGTLLDGTIFDSTESRGKPSTFAVDDVITGWKEVLQKMSVGSEWKIFIPYEMGYEDAEMSKIPPYSTLLFEVKIHEIKKTE